MIDQSKQPIRERQAELEKEISAMLKETKSDFDLKDVKNLIYREEDSHDFHRFIAMFDNGGDASQLDTMLELVSDAWNYFPHKALNGLSPAEKLLEHREKK